MRSKPTARSITRPTPATLIPEDRERQALLEEAGWSFCRVRHADFAADPERQIETITETLRRQRAQPRPRRARLDRRRGRGGPQRPGRGRRRRGRAGSRNPAATGRRLPRLANDATRLVDQVTAAEVQSTRTELSGNGTARPTRRRQWRQRSCSRRPGRGLDRRARLARKFPVWNSSHSSASARTRAPGRPSRVADRRLRRRTPRAGATPSIDGSPLGLIAMRVAELVRARGSIGEDELARAYASHYDVEVPASWQRTLKRFAWTGKALRYLELDGDIWRPGLETAASRPAIRRLDIPRDRGARGRIPGPTTTTRSRICSPRSTAARAPRNSP